jgi:hypothetical protein
VPAPTATPVPPTPTPVAPTPTAPAPGRASTATPADTGRPPSTADVAVALARLRVLLAAADRLPGVAKGKRDDADERRRELLDQLQDAEAALRQGKIREAREQLRDLAGKLDEAARRGALDPRLANRIQDELAALLGRL